MVNIDKLIEESEYWLHGIRADARDLPVGYQLEPSHDWFQDYPGECEDPYEDPDYPFDEEMDRWDGGDLRGTCSIDLELENVESAIERAKREYLVPGGHIYLIAGDTGHHGNDANELIIRNAVVLAKII